MYIYLYIGIGKLAGGEADEARAKGERSEDAT
jgi:hypothetical protein